MGEVGKGGEVVGEASTPQPVITRSAGARQRTVLVKRTVLKRTSKKTDSERRVTETVFAKVCLPLIHVIIFRIVLVSFIYPFFFTKEKSAHSH